MMWVTNWFDNRLRELYKNKPLIIPKNVELKVVKFTVGGQRMHLEQISTLKSSVKFLHLNMVMLISQNNKKISFAKIIENLQFLEIFIFHPINVLMMDKTIHYDAFETNSVKELLKIPHFTNLKKLELCNISGNFEIETFYYSFLKTNKIMDVHLRFLGEISEDYKQKISTIIDEILELASENNFWPPHIRAYIDPKKEDNLEIAHSQYSKNLSTVCSLRYPNY
uniref:DUF38 domain-containing protein n=1 Tax=Panagrolaimus sp. ES5 TaxID=591445 RepID=A0AC34FLA4_9BILA